MKYEIKKIDLTIARELSPPAFELPARTADLIAHLFRELNPRFPLSVNEIKSYGGTSYGDVKITVSTISGKARIDVFVNGYTIEFIDLVQSEEDLTTLNDFAEIADTNIRNVLVESEFVGRVIGGRVWMDCEGGAEAVDALLRERGNRAIDMTTGRYKKFDKKFTILVDCDDTKGMTMKFAIQRSEITTGDLFVDARFTFDSSHNSVDLSEQFSLAQSHFVEILERVGLKNSAETTS